MRLLPTLNSSAFFQAKNQFINSFSWQAVKTSVSKQVSTWCQPLFAWTQPEETPFFMSASEEAGFMAHQAWRSAFKHQLRILRQQIRQTYQEGRMLSSDKLRETLIADQLSFTSKAVSALFYDRSLKRLAQHFPHYAHALEGTAEHFKTTLKSHPQKALRYFYHDIVNHIVLWSGRKITLAQLMDALDYYESLVPASFYQTVLTTLQTFNAPTLENSVDAFRGVPRKTVEALLAQINQAFTNTNHSPEMETASSLQRFMQKTQMLAKQGLNYAKQHPYQVMSTLTVATVLGYRYSATSGDNTLIPGQPLSYFNEFNTLQFSQALPPMVMMVSVLPLALKQESSFLQVAVPVMAGWLTQLSPVAAQTERWAKSLGGTVDDSGSSVQQTSDGGYIVTGYTRSYGAGAYDIWLSRWTSTGTLSWVRTLGGTYYDDSYSVQQTSDGGYIVAGTTVNFGSSSSDLCLSKWAADGTLSWVKTLGGSNAHYGYSVQQTTDGGYIVSASNGQLLLSKWAANGSLSWVKSLAVMDNNYGYSVQQTSDGGFIVAGFGYDFVPDDWNLLLSKWTTSGTLSWVKTLGGAYDDYAYSVQQTVDGGYIVTGFTLNFGAGNYDLWLSKWTSTGTLSWVKTLGGNSSDYGYSVQQTSDGGYIVTGYTTSFGAGGEDLWLSKWAADGSLSWVKTLGGTGDDRGYSVQQTSDGGYIVTGYTTSFGAGNSDLWLVKWDSQGNIGGDSCIFQPNITSLTISVSATNFALTPSTPAVSVRNVAASAQAVSPTVLTLCNDAPALANGGGGFTYTENDSARVIDNSILVDGVDDIVLSSARVSISMQQFPLNNKIPINTGLSKIILVNFGLLFRRNAMKTKPPKTRKHLQLPGLLKCARQSFERIDDPLAGKSRYALVDCLMSGLALFGLKYASLLQFDKSYQTEKIVRHNLSTLYGVHQAPCDTYLRERLDEVTPSQLQKTMNKIIAQLQRSKVLEQYRYLDEYCLVSMDGTGCFSSHDIHCEHCCEKQHRDGSVTYYHQMLAAVMVHPSYSTVLPLVIEPVQKQDGKTKNDCEHTAAKRLLEKLRTCHPHLKMIVVLDGLYADASMITLLKKLKFPFIITARENDLKYLFEFYHATKKAEVHTKDDKTERRYQFAHQLPLNDAHADMEVNVLACLEITKQKKTRFCWITDLPLNAHRVEMMAQGGRARWKIENETFNTLKNQGYQFDHNFGHGYQHLSTVFAYLMFIAFLIDQIQQYACQYFKAALKRWGSLTFLWQKIRGLFFHFFIDTWEDLYTALLNESWGINIKEVLNTS